MTFTINIKPISWNELIRKNHWIVTKISNEFKYATLEAIQKAKIKPFRRDRLPVNIHIMCRWKYKKKHDIDAVFAKAAVDQLVISKILPDDSLEYVRSVTYTGAIGCEKDEIVITIESTGINHVRSIF